MTTRNNFKHRALNLLCAGLLATSLSWAQGRDDSLLAAATAEQPAVVKRWSGW